MKKKIIVGKKRVKKSGYDGNEMWRTHRLEGVVKNKGIKPIKRRKQEVKNNFRLYKSSEVFTL